MTSPQFHRLKLTKTQREKFSKVRRLDQLQKMDPVDFERYCGWLYELDGYKAHMTATSGDEGVDLLLKKGRETTVVQCKRYSGTVGQPTVRDLYGTQLHTKAKKSVLVTTGRISSAAESWAVNKPIELIDGNDLMAWLNANRRMGKGNSFFQRNFSSCALMLGLLVAVSVCVFSSLFAINLALNRTEGRPRPLPPTLAIPTSPLTPAPTVTTDDEFDAAPTATLVGLPTPTVVEVDSADFTVPRAEAEIPLAVNASLWENIEGIAVSEIVSQDDSWDGSFDVSATWKLAYDDRFLYGYVEVTDDTIAQIESARTAYRGDSLELEIDTLGDAADRSQPDDYQYLISPGNFANLSASIFRFRGSSGAMVDDWGTNGQVLSQKTADGYAVAFRIPWFDVRFPGIPQPGSNMNIALNVNDNDQVGESAQEVMISHVAGRRWSQPATWGPITLGE